MCSLLTMPGGISSTPLVISHRYVWREEDGERGLDHTHGGARYIRSIESQLLHLTEIYTANLHVICACVVLLVFHVGQMFVHVCCVKISQGGTRQWQQNPTIGKGADKERD